MKKNCILFLIFISSNGIAQNIYSSGAGSGVMLLKPINETSPRNLKRGSYIGPHVLGDSVTMAINNFEKEYVYFKPTSGAYAVEEKIIVKQNIYKKVHDFDRYIVKSFQSDFSSKQELTNRLLTVINVGTKLLNFDTQQVEREIKKLGPVEFEKYLLNLQF